LYPASAHEKYPAGNSLDGLQISMGCLVEKTFWGESQTRFPLLFAEEQKYFENTFL